MLWRSWVLLNTVGFLEMLVWWGAWVSQPCPNYVQLWQPWFREDSWSWWTETLCFCTIIRFWCSPITPGCKHGRLGLSGFYIQTIVAHLTVFKFLPSLSPSRALSPIFFLLFLLQIFPWPPRSQVSKITIHLIAPPVFTINCIPQSPSKLGHCLKYLLLVSEAIVQQTEHLPWTSWPKFDL